MNLIIKNLLSDSYVTVTEVPENKRNKIVRMTDAGRAYCEKVVRHITWAEDTAMSMFTPEEQKQLIDLLRTFTKNLTMLVNQETRKFKMEFTDKLLPEQYDSTPDSHIHMGGWR